MFEKKKVLAVITFALMLMQSLQAVASPKVDQSNPLKLLQDIYGNYPDSEPAYSWHAAKLAVDAHDIPYTASFAKLYSFLMDRHNNDQEGGPRIDVNITCDCQDGTPEQYRIQQLGLRQENLAHFRIDLRGKDLGERHVLWSLIREGDKWVVQDVGPASIGNSIVSRMRACLPKKGGD